MGSSISNLHANRQMNEYAYKQCRLKRNNFLFNFLIKNIDWKKITKIIKWNTVFMKFFHNYFKYQFQFLNRFTNVKCTYVDRNTHSNVKSVSSIKYTRPTRKCSLIKSTVKCISVTRTYTNLHTYTHPQSTHTHWQTAVKDLYKVGEMGAL